MKINKTNAMRFLDNAKIKYEIHTYDASDGHIDAISVAQKSGIDVQYIYKTLVTRSASKKIYVFVINAADELDLKLCAKSVNEKSIEMIHVSEINALTGYIRGGCSPLGMKKNYPIYLSDTAVHLDKIVFSGGKIGLQIETSVNDFMEATHAQVVSVIKNNE